MSRLIIVFSYLIYVGCSNISEENEQQNNDTQISTNVKTYFFQMRKDSTGNETTYKKVKGFENTQILDAVDDLEIVLDKESKRTRYSAFDNLRKRRKEYMKLDLSNPKGYNSQFLDDEWKYNINNQYIEIPDITNEIFKSIEEQSYGMSNITIVRCIFENVTDQNAIIKFNLNSLKNKSSEIIVDAELHIYRSSENNETDSNAEAKYSSDQVMRLYQILPINDTDENLEQNPDVHKLLNVIYVSSRNSGWQIFKVKKVIENWLNGQDNLGFLLSSSDTWGNIVPINIEHKYNGKYQPMLIVYLRDNNHQNTISSATKPNAKQVEQYIRIAKNKNILPENPNPCGRHVWFINFQELGWNNFIISPSGFMAFKCKGSCTSSILSPFTNHGRLTNTYQYFLHLKRPCCVPDSYKSLPVMFYDKYQNVVIKIYNDMIASSCACR